MWTCLEGNEGCEGVTGSVLEDSRALLVPPLPACQSFVVQTVLVNEVPIISLVAAEHASYPLTTLAPLHVTKPFSFPAEKVQQKKSP